MIIRNLTRGTVLCRLGRPADGVVERARGLMFRKNWEGFDGLLLSPCSSIHTCFMRMAIDVCFLDGEQQVLKIVSALGPWRLALGAPGTRQTLELPLGTLKQTETRNGDRLAREPGVTEESRGSACPAGRGRR